MSNHKADLRIRAVEMPDDIHDPQFDDLDERLQKPPFVMVFQAPVKSGKSTAMMNLLYNDNFYRDRFDNVIICSPTIEGDLTWATALDDDKNYIITGSKLEDLDNVIYQIWNRLYAKVTEAEKNGEHIPHTLVIIDDCLGKMGRKFEEVIARHRHPRMSFLVSSQDFRKIPQVCRNNASHYVIFRTYSKVELKKMQEEFGSVVGEDNFIRLYEQATKKKFNFLQLKKWDREAWQNFDTLLWKEEQTEEQA